VRTLGPLIAGGRYDGLLTRLGAREPIPAVGFAASIEELAACGGGNAGGAA
jgi:ATP phosphoribosyltransferase regulatory subunit